MRLLPDRPDHASHRAAPGQQASQRPGYRHGHVRKYLPLRHLSAHSGGDSSGCEGDGMKFIENVSRASSSRISRRGFLGGALASGVFILSVRLIPEPLWASEGEAAAPPLAPTIWMSIASDGTVTIVAHRSEM